MPRKKSATLCRRWHGMSSRFARNVYANRSAKLSSHRTTQWLCGEIPPYRPVFILISQSSKLDVGSVGHAERRCAEGRGPGAVKIPLAAGRPVMQAEKANKHRKVVILISQLGAWDIAS
jgi:hypothetical protein